MWKRREDKTEPLSADDQAALAELREANKRLEQHDREMAEWRAARKPMYEEFQRRADAFEAQNRPFRHAIKKRFYKLFPWARRKKPWEREWK